MLEEYRCIIAERASTMTDEQYNALMTEVKITQLMLKHTMVKIGAEKLQTDTIIQLLGHVLMRQGAPESQVMEIIQNYQSQRMPELAAEYKTQSEEFLQSNGLNTRSEE